MFILTIADFVFCLFLLDFLIIQYSSSIIHPKIELEKPLKTFGVNFVNNMGVGVVSAMVNLPDYRL